MAKRAKRTVAKRIKSRSQPKGLQAKRRSVKRQKARSRPRRPSISAKPKTAVGRSSKSRQPRASAKPRGRALSLNRERRNLVEGVLVPTPPSSLNLDRRGSAARSGRKELKENLLKHGDEMSPAITGGDVDADWEDAYFTGDEAPGGDNPTPDQDIVDDIGKALGVEYQDNEELKSSDKVIERDKHRWELDPASSEDYKNRK